MKGTGLKPANRVQLPEGVTLVDRDLMVLVSIRRLRNRRELMSRPGVAS